MGSGLLIGKDLVRRAAMVASVVALTVGLGGCSSKSESQLASDALNAGVQAQQAGNLDEATKDYKTCLAHDATNKTCIYDLGTVAQAQGQTLLAESDYRLALIYDPKYPAATYNLAVLRANAGARDEAIGLYRQYVQEAPNDPAGHLNLGLLLRAVGDQQGAAHEFATAQQLKPGLQIPSPPAPQPSPLVPQVPSASPAST
jgi:tetratricopeptide (TPR) repeat protein